MCVGWLLAMLTGHIIPFWNPWDHTSALGVITRFMIILRMIRKLRMYSSWSFGGDGCLREGLKKISKSWLLTNSAGPPPSHRVGTQILNFFLPIFFILMDSIHFKTDFSMIFFFLPSLPSVTYYLQSQNCTIPTIF